MGLKGKERKFDYFLNTLFRRFNELSPPWSSWYEASVDFSKISSDLAEDCFEIVSKDHVLDEDSGKNNGFRVIENEKIDWSSWSTAAVQVEPL